MKRQRMMKVAKRQRMWDDDAAADDEAAADDVDDAAANMLMCHDRFERLERRRLGDPLHFCRRSHLLTLSKPSGSARRPDLAPTYPYTYMPV